MTRIRTIAFALCSFTAGLAAVVYASRLGSLSVGFDGGTYVLYAVAAAVIGGASLFGGYGKPIHPLLGGLVIATLTNGLALLNITTAGTDIATAAVLIVAVAVDATLRRRGRSGAGADAAAADRPPTREGRTGLICRRLAAPALVALVLGAAGPVLATTSPTTTTSSWTVYHGGPAGEGVATGVSAVSVSKAAWTSTTLDGELYGEPLVSGGQVFVATENDTVYALSATTGSVVWATHVGTAVPSSMLPCGDISPTVGITGTPVIDETRAEVFVVADELVNGKAAHELVGLSTATGKTELDQVVDPAGSTPTALLQRTGLTLDAGRVVFGFGGNDGDCASYRGRVVSVPESGGTPDFFTVDAAAGDSQGAIWMGGAAPVVDASGNIWVEAGNGSVYSSAQAYDDSDSVLELSPSLTLPPVLRTPPRGPPTTRRTSTCRPPRPCCRTARSWPRASHASSTCSTGPPSVGSGTRRRSSGTPVAVTSTVAWPWWARRSTSPA